MRRLDVFSLSWFCDVTVSCKTEGLSTADSFKRRWPQTTPEFLSHFTSPNKGNFHSAVCLWMCVCVCLGYNSMGYEMSKPNLRAELEADLKLVSEGRKDKQSVLQHHIQKYKTVFIESVKKAKKLVGFVSHYAFLHIWCPILVQNGPNHVRLFTDGVMTRASFPLGWMKPCRRIWVQLWRWLKQSSRTWRSRCQWGSVLAVVGTWFWRRRGKETGEKGHRVGSKNHSITEEQRCFLKQAAAHSHTPQPHPRPCILKFVKLTIPNSFASVSVNTWSCCR